MVKFQFQVNHLPHPVVYSLILFCACLLHLFMILLTVLSLYLHNLHLGLVYFCFNVVSLKVSFSYPCLCLLVWDLTCLSLEISVQLIFFPFLFSNNCSFIDPCVVCVISGRCNYSSFPLFFNVVFESSYQCIDTIFSAAHILQHRFCSSENNPQLVSEK